jgi:hypothetical protein
MQSLMHSMCRGCCVLHMLACIATGGTSWGIRRTTAINAQQWLDQLSCVVSPFVQPSQTVPAITDKFKTITGLTAGATYYAMVSSVYCCAHVLKP